MYGGGATRAAGAAFGAEGNGSAVGETGCVEMLELRPGAVGSEDPVGEGILGE
jgi:hypothetical protein